MAFRTCCPEDNRKINGRNDFFIFKSECLLGIACLGSML